MPCGCTSCSQLEGYGRDAIDAVIVGTVVPRALHNLEVLAVQIFRRRAAHRRPGAGRLWRSSSMSRSRRRVGADRAVNAIAAHALHAGDLIVIDFGTATTFDVVDYHRRL